MIAYGFLFRKDGTICESIESRKRTVESLIWHANERCSIWIIRNDEEQATCDAIALRKSMLNAKKGIEYSLNRL